MPRVLICRHGETKLNAGGESAERIRGWKDIPLDDNGQRQAQELAKELAVYDIREIWSSPLSRAFDTAMAIPPRLTFLLFAKTSRCCLGI